MGTFENAKFVDYYTLLGVEPTADREEIRRAYIAHAKQHHPDTGGSTGSMQMLNTAYTTLTSTSAKAAYDLLHSLHTGTTQPHDYRYTDKRKVRGVNNMSDEEVDVFLDTLFAQYRSRPTKTRQTVGTWLKKLF
jgi:curved DNA-binding protein CbpA